MLLALGLGGSLWIGFAFQASSNAVIGKLFEKNVDERVKALERELFILWFKRRYMRLGAYTIVRPMWLQMNLR